MRILFLGDVVGSSGCSKLVENLPSQKKQREIDFVIVNGENADESGVGLTQKICEKFFSSGVDVITSGNHIWDQKDIMEFIENEKRILRPKNFFEPSPGKGFEIFTTVNNFKIGVLNLIGNVFMKKSNDVFEAANQFINKFKLKKDFDFLVVDFHGEITSEKNAIGHFFDGQATLVVGTHTHVQTADEQILPKGTAFLCDAGMCGPKESILGRRVEPILHRMKTSMPQTMPVAKGPVEIRGALVDIDTTTGKAVGIERIAEIID